MPTQESTNIISNIGLPPGEAIFIGEKKVEKTSISVIDYDKENFLFQEISDYKQVHSFLISKTMSWINVVGLHEADLIKKILEPLSVHNLVIEDVLHTQQRTKVEFFDDYLFVIMKEMELGQNTDQVTKNQVSLIVNENFVISFCEKEMDIFKPLIGRIKNSKGRIRRSGSDYLTFAIMDIVVDNYFTEIEKINDVIEGIEEAIINELKNDTTKTIHNLKRQLISFRRSTNALRESLSLLVKNEENWIAEDIIPYFRDVYDHLIFINGTIEAQRDTAMGLMDFHISMVSNRMNEVMKVLTIIATIFIPLSFIAGIYGMNFEYIPELKLQYGYHFFWVIVLIVSGGLLLFFRKRKWI